MPTQTPNATSQDFRTAIARRSLTGEIPSREAQTRYLNEISVRFEDHSKSGRQSPVKVTSNYELWLSLFEDAADPNWLSQLSQLRGTGILNEIDYAKPSIVERNYGPCRWSAPAPYDTLAQGLQDHASIVENSIKELRSRYLRQLDPRHLQADSSLSAETRRAFVLCSHLANYSLLVFERAERQLQHLDELSAPLVGEAENNLSKLHRIVVDLPTGSPAEAGSKAEALALYNNIHGLTIRRSASIEHSILLGLKKTEDYLNIHTDWLRYAEPEQREDKFRNDRARFQHMSRELARSTNRKMADVSSFRDKVAASCNNTDHRVSDILAKDLASSEQRIEELLAGKQFARGSSDKSEVVEPKHAAFTDAELAAEAALPRASSAVSSGQVKSKSGKGKRRAKAKKPSTASSGISPETPETVEEGNGVSLSNLKDSLREQGLLDCRGYVSGRVNIAPASGHAGDDWDTKDGTVTVSRSIARVSSLPTKSVEESSRRDPGVRTNQGKPRSIPGDHHVVERDTPRSPRSMDSKGSIGAITSHQDLNAKLSKFGHGGEVEPSEEELEELRRLMYLPTMGHDELWKKTLAARSDDVETAPFRYGY